VELGGEERAPAAGPKAHHSTFSFFLKRVIPHKTLATRPESLDPSPTLPLPLHPISSADLGQVPFHAAPPEMAPIKDETVQDLKDLVHKLESRVHQLEARLQDGGEKPKSSTDAMRMILIGPPGAGEKGPVFSAIRFADSFK